MTFPLRPLATSVAVLLALSAPFPAHSQAPSAPTKDKVGLLGPNRYQTPTNQILTPAGTQVDLPGIRPLAVAISPNGRFLVTSGKTGELFVLDAKTGKVLQKVAFPGKAGSAATPVPTTDPDEARATTPAGSPLKPDTGGQISFTGLVFSPDGSRLYLSNVNGDIKVFTVNKDTVAPFHAFALPHANAPKRKDEIPSGLAVSADGKQLYVAGNLGNRVYELNAETGAVTHTWDVGVAPFDVALASGKLYVSNWGGRRPDSKSLVGPAGRGTTVRVDSVRHIASEGSVTVIDLKSGQVTSEIQVELHASALAVSPNGRWVVCANASSDTISVIDSRNDQVAQKLWARSTPADLFSATPNAVAFDKSGKRLYVCNGTQNAVAVLLFDPEDKESKFLGMIPTGWFPGGIAFDATHKQLCVANIKGIGGRRVDKPTDKPRKPEQDGQNSKDYFGTLSLIPLPDDKQLANYTAVAEVNMRHAAVQASRLPARPDQPARVIPERVGEPSLIKHVIYIIKENRTYDQILGDVKEGNGNAKLCTFGEKYTPNQHKLVRDFVLLDNTYCSGIQSADGHQWTNSAITTDYVERGHAGWPRSYMNMKTEDSMDALAYSPAGFIWDLAVKHKVSVRNYGEACISECGWADKSRKGKPAWKDYLADLDAANPQTSIKCKPGVGSLKSISKLDTVGWDLNVPDVIRAKLFAQELKSFEQKGSMPQLSIMLLPNDHTAGTPTGKPTPGAMVADNDLALGRIVEAVTHSKFWPDTAIFVIEDDPQNGWDHVSGYRTTCYVISPYTKRGQTISTQYNQTSVIRTMELMLGLPPMNIMDASATPMNDVFTDTPDLTPFVAVANKHPIDELTPEKKKIADRQLRSDSAASEKLPLSEPDQCEEGELNEILWRAMKGTQVPFPAWAVTKVDDDD